VKIGFVKNMPETNIWSIQHVLCLVNVEVDTTFVLICWTFQV